MEAESATMPVAIVQVTDVILAHPVTFKIIPMTVDKALNEMVIETFDDSDPNSPNRAG